MQWSLFQIAGRPLFFGKDNKNNEQGQACLEFIEGKIVCPVTP